MLTRRRLLASATAALGAGCAPAPQPESPPARIQSDPTKPPVLLLRSGWQWENIGDIAHTPGILRMLRTYLREATVILWSNAVGHGVEPMIKRHFPHVQIIQGTTDDAGKPASPTVAAAFEEADFLLHGSGPSVVGKRDVQAWRKQTGKPYGIFGVTITVDTEPTSPAMDDDLKDLLANAEFTYTRETTSLKNLRSVGLEGERYAFVPDATFNLKILDDERAKAFLAKSGLENKKFIAVVPRLRYTPYHEFKKVNWSDEKIRQRTEANNRTAEADHAKLREAITMWVRETGMKVLLCPEMTYQLDIMDPLVYRPLPNDVKKSVVRRRTYWLTDEAASVYRRAALLLSFDCHSPIIAAANDTPAVYVHQPESGIKGQMWKDVGLNRSYLDIEETTGQQIGERLMEFHHNYDAAVVHTHEAVIYARSLQSGGMDPLRKLLIG